MIDHERWMIDERRIMDIDDRPYHKDEWFMIHERLMKKDEWFIIDGRK